MDRNVFNTILALSIYRKTKLSLDDLRFYCTFWYNIKFNNWWINKLVLNVYKMPLCLRFALLFDNISPICFIHADIFLTQYK